jgi:hypothetical protein
VPVPWALIATLLVTAGSISDQIPAGRARLVLHNASGRTLLGGTYTVRIDGRKVARLKRGEYAVVDLEPGRHLARAESFREVPFVIEAGRVAHWAVAYSPDRHWGPPLTGSGFGYGIVPDRLGERLAGAFRRVEPLESPHAPDSIGSRRH